MDALVGIPLTNYAAPLRRVPAHHNHKPVRAFDPMSSISRLARDYIAERFEETEFMSVAHNLPLWAFAKLNFDQLCKIRYSTSYMMSSDVDDLFKTAPSYSMVHKIINSMWRWGVGKGTWNQIVDAYHGICSFSFDHPDFEIRLDHTTGYNPQGYSEHSRTFLDGVFAFLVYYRGRRVMTLGFSIMENRRVLIQQVQMTNRRGNRFLFKLPENYLEFIVERFRAAFPDHKLYMVDGEMIARKSIRSYYNGYDDARTLVARYELKELLSASAQDRLADYRAQAAEFKAKIEHLKSDVPRLRAFYSNTGRFTQGSELTVNHLTHYLLQPQEPVS